MFGPVFFVLSVLIGTVVYGEGTTGGCQSITGHPSFNLARTIMDIHIGNNKACVGVMISRFQVITASECFPADVDPSEITVSPFGKSTPSSPGKSITVENSLTVVNLLNSPIDQNFQPGTDDLTFAEYLQISSKTTVPRLAYQRIGQFSGFCLFENPDDHGKIVENTGRNRCNIGSDAAYGCFKLDPAPSRNLDLGSPLLAEKDGVVYVFAMVVSQHGGGKKYFKAARVNKLYKELGCSVELSGIWSEGINQNTADDVGDEEHWTSMTPQPCGNSPPICLEAQIVTPAGELFPGQNGCPHDQAYTMSVRNGIQCVNSDQPGTCKCHDYAIKVKCPWIA